MDAGRPTDADELVKFMAGEKREADLGGMRAVLKNVERMGASAAAVTLTSVAAKILIENFDDVLAAYLDKEIAGRPPLPPEAE